MVVTWQNGEVSHGTAGVRAYYDKMMKGDRPVVKQVTCARSGLPGLGRGPLLGTRLGRFSISPQCDTRGAVTCPPDEPSH